MPTRLDQETRNSPRVWQPLRPPAYSQVAEHFCEIEGVAETCRMPDVSQYLRKAKLAWMNNHGSRVAKQTRVRDFFGDGKEAGEGASGCGRRSA